MADPTIKRTPLYDLHLKEGAKLTYFGGWEMPVEYEGIIAEHRAVRTRAGLFDVSHMGELEITGADALDLVQKVIANDASRLALGQALYTPICRPDGGTVDDVLVYRLGESRYLVVPNAANIAKGHAVFREAAAEFAADVVDRSDAYGLLSLQGPLAGRILSRLTSVDLAGLKRFRCCEGRVADANVLISRTGYTGEDGFELYCRAADTPALWTALRAAGADDGLALCGLGARDTLRLEAALPLYGHELTERINPLEAGLARFVKLDKPEFTGRAALSHIQAQGPIRAIVGLEMTGRGIPRAQYPVQLGDDEIGYVTSGSYAPTLDKNIALALIDRDYAQADRDLAVVIRGRAVAARVVELPFYRRAAG